MKMVEQLKKQVQKCSYENECELPFPIDVFQRISSLHK
jgi:hypothetical protein